jgi:hypothetical protein
MAEIRLLRGQTALIDDEDLPRVAGFRWRLSSEGYVVASQGSRQRGTFKTVLLHRVIRQTPPGLETDHVNTLSRLDNRKSNLRTATKSQNQGNRKPNSNGITSRFKGVYWYSRDGCWKASGPKMNRAGKVTQGHLGFFEAEEDAARAYNKAALAHWGEFACLNSV